ncbi:hypothetical protein Aglo03_31350 [Actinokineospora globicatena]|uniref:HTH cro/C1-type domain-containing protein n=1 Tax=Actinokineospora globicatena TaxID=103729 RepID=A0A9W6QPM5_9PSEU|nr:hypothetical protein Aglo03_31350 [Actinokineospora globicatena]
MLAEALPFVGPSGVRGIAGLRPHPQREHLRLRQYDDHGRCRAEIRLLGLDKRQWRAFTESVQANDALAPWLDPRDGLHEQEVSLLEQGASLPADLMSAVLRRFGLWGDASWFDSAVVDDAFEVQWAHGPSASVIAAILGDSAVAVPGAVVAVQQVSQALRGVLLRRAQAAARCDQDLTWAWSSLVDAARSHEPSDPIPNKPILPDSPNSQWHQDHVTTWEEAEMRAALAAREVSSVYRLLRRTGVSQRQIAAMTGQSQSEVSEILKGRQVMAYDVLARIADGLGIPRGYMGLAYDEVTEVREVTAHEAEQSKNDEARRRREFLMHAAEMTMGISALSASHRLVGGWQLRGRAIARGLLGENSRLAD